MRVFVTGGTGLIGSALVRRLTERGDRVALLTRRPEHAKSTANPQTTMVTGDPTQAGPWMDAVGDCDAVVNLAGENIFNRRWWKSFKQLMRDSRLTGTKNVVAALAKNPHHGDGSPKTLINGSAIGFYGPHGDEELTEESAAGSDFLAELCVDWEKEATTAERHGVRVVLLRTGVVLSKDGGALTNMLTPFKMFVGGPVGSGRQFMSWIHIDDHVGMILFALDHPEIAGPLNATAPNPVTNKEFSKALGRVLHRPSFMKTPGFVLRVALGEVANVVTKGQRVLPKKAQQPGFQFKYTDAEAALRDLLAR